jgi:hypothetical protein
MTGGKNKQTPLATAWTGITAIRPDCHDCTWSPRAGQWEVKFISAACRRHAGSGLAIRTSRSQ